MLAVSVIKLFNYSFIIVGQTLKGTTGSPPRRDVSNALNYRHTMLYNIEAL